LQHHVRWDVFKCCIDGRIYRGLVARQSDLGRSSRFIISSPIPRMTWQLFRAWENRRTRPLWNIVSLDQRDVDAGRLAERAAVPAGPPPPKHCSFPQDCQFTPRLPTRPSTWWQESATTSPGGWGHRPGDALRQKHETGVMVPATTNAGRGPHPFLRVISFDISLSMDP
jgi:hypothetical protein